MLMPHCLADPTLRLHNDSLSGCANNEGLVATVQYITEMATSRTFGVQEVDTRTAWLNSLSHCMDLWI